MNPKYLFILILVVLVNCKHKHSPKRVNLNADYEDSSLAEHVWRGVCYAHSWEDGGNMGYGSQASLLTLKHLKKKNVGWISLTPFGFMDGLNSTEVQGTHTHNKPIAKSGETDQRIRDEVKLAKAQGFKIMLKPHIWVAEGKWRGVIDPKNPSGETDWATWWKSHSDWILHYAKIAEELDIEALVVGLELHTAVQNDPDALIKLIEATRKIYKGHLTYSANWNEPVPLKVWRRLDSIGIQLYPPLQKGQEKNGTQAWKKNLQSAMLNWEAISASSGKPIILTEVGFRSGAKAASHPNAWPDRNPDEDSDPALQSELYRFLLNDLANRPSILGIFFWKYFTNSKTKEEGPNGFSPLGKPAEEVMARFFSRKKTKDR